MPAPAQHRYPRQHRHLLRGARQPGLPDWRREWQCRSGGFPRGGYSRIAPSIPSRHGLPSQPGADGYALYVGIGRHSRQWRVAALNEYGDSDTIHASGTVYGFTGDYHFRQHLFGMTVSYRF
jgi:hypothetical protein